MKVLIIGLDAATWDVFDDFLLDNHMPNLNRLKRQGYSGILQSTEPPTTPTGWTTILTGCSPATHSITGFQKYSFKEDSLSILNSTDCRVPNMWQELSHQGYKVASINVPWTYPCPEVNGIIVAGFGCPGPQSQFTYPDSFKDELLRSIPDYTIVAKCGWSAKDSFEKFGQYIELIERGFQHRLETARLVSKKVDWDAMMVQFHEIDSIQHCMWDYLGNGSRDKYPQERDRLFKMFERLDKAIEGLLDCSTTGELLVVVVSDHGAGRLIGDIRPNILLHDWGYLKFKGPFSRIASRQLRRLRRNLHLAVHKQKKIDRFGMKQPRELNIDWKKTKAMVLHTAINGYLYLNPKTRHLQSESQYNAVIEDLKKRFSQVQNHVSKKPLFRQVATSAELYGREKSVSEHVGDLILIPEPGYETRTSTSTRKGYLYFTPDDLPLGTHRPEGIYLLSGSGAKAVTNKQAEMVDIAPTVYAALGAKLPPYLDGKVLNEAFVEGLDVKYSEHEDKVRLKTVEKRALSPEEQAAISKHLSDLGYL